MKYLSFFFTVLVATLFFFCTKNPSAPSASANAGSAKITVTAGNVGALAKESTGPLAKRLNISYSRLCIMLSAQGEPTVYDTLPLSGNAQVTVSETYHGLASLKTWTLSAKSYDDRDSMIHSGDTAFEVRPRQTAQVNLALSAKYSMLKANFFPIRDSVTRCELLVEGSLKATETFAKQSRLGDTVVLSFDYLQTNMPQRIRLNAYGDMWGFDTLLYTGDTSINPLPGVNSVYAVTLKWVGPALPPPGQATINVVLGAIGNIEIKGYLENKDIVRIFDDFNTDTLQPFWNKSVSGLGGITFYPNESILSLSSGYGGAGSANITNNSSFSLSDGGLVFEGRIRPYEDNNNAYGDGQPRGLANGTDRSNAIEFISASGFSIKARTVNNGVATETLYPLGSTVNEMHLYKIDASQSEVRFYFDGALIATHTVNIPTAPLNIYLGTSYSGYGNVPIHTDSVSLEFNHK